MTTENVTPAGAVLTDGIHDLSLDMQRRLKADIADAIVQFQRDFYVLSEHELRGVWLGKLRPFTEDAIRRHVPPVMQAAIRSEFTAHHPLWEFLRSFFYDNTVLNPLTMQNEPKADFFLWPDLHRERLCIPIEDYLLAPPDPHTDGWAIFITRYGLKTYFMVCAAAWVLTRHRVAFDDFTCIRFVHDIVPDAVKRTEMIKNLFQKHEGFKALFPECALPRTKTWETFEEWNLQGREDAAGDLTLDPQVKALGMRGTKQGAHPHYNFIDDLENEDHMDSPASRKEFERFMGAIHYAAQLGLSRTLLSGTFYTRLGTHARILEMAKPIDDYGEPVIPNWKVTHIPAAENWAAPCPGDADAGKSCPGHDCPKTLTYPTRLSHEIIHAKLASGSRLKGDDLFDRMQILLEFGAAGKVEFQPHGWQLLDFDHPATPFERQLIDSLATATVFIQIDSAWKDSTSEGRGANTAILAVAYPTIDCIVYRVVLDTIYDNTIHLDVGCRAALEMAGAFDARAIIVEEHGEKVSGSTLDRLSKELGLRYRQTPLKVGSPATDGNIYALFPKGGAREEGAGRISAWKMARFKKLQPIWNDRRVFLNAAIPCLDGPKEETTQFPFAAACDWLDALAQGDDDRVRALIPQSRFRRPRGRPTPDPVLRIPRSRYTGLVDIVRLN